MSNLAKDIEKLEAEIERLHEYEKLFNKAVKITFGYDSKEIRKILRDYTKNNVDSARG
ncbi:MAG: hypothetical protein K6B68_14660 [Eubacterium sp.]|nr:hypothetical protein [Eubacterium sp.]